MKTADYKIHERHEGNRISVEVIGETPEACDRGAAEYRRAYWMHDCSYPQKMSSCTAVMTRFLHCD